VKASAKRVLFWTPRILTFLYAAFISMFAFDVFGEGHGTWQSVVALLIHLIPAALMIAVLIVSWRWGWIGAVLFAAAGPYCALTTLEHPDWIVWIAGPLFMIAIWYLLNWLNRKELRASSGVRSVSVVLAAAQLCLHLPSALITPLAAAGGAQSR
jgi:hypothetical protein